MNEYPNMYQNLYQPSVSPNMYYPGQATPIQYQPRNWQQQYTPVQQTATPSYSQTQQSMNSPMVWVQGEAGAKAYVLPNGTTLPLWDSEAQVIYIKSVDMNGKPSMTILDYTDRNEPSSSGEKQPEYVTRDQLDSLSAQFTSLNEKLGGLGDYVTRDQFDALNIHLDDLGSQIEDIENRITSFGKPQQNPNSNRRGNK